MKFPKLWIVDDDAITRLLIRKKLLKTAVSHTVDEFENGRLALDHLLAATQQHYPDLILLDINMPVLNGWEFMDALQNWGNAAKDHLKVAIISSSIDWQDQEKAKTYAQIKAYLSKPLQMDKLLEI